MFANSSSLIKIAVATWEPFVRVDYEQDKKVVRGFIAILLDYLVRVLNIRYLIVDTPNAESWGSRLPNGSFSGMIGMLQRNETDLMLVPFLLSYHRSMAVQFIYPVAILTSHILVEVPLSAAKSFHFIDCLSWKAYTCLTFSFLLVCLAGMFVDRFTERRHLPGASYGYAWTVFSALMLKSAHAFPDHSASRLVLVPFQLGCFVVLSALSSVLTSLLSVHELPPFLNKIEEIAMFPNIQPYFIKGDREIDHFMNSDDPADMEVWRRVNRSEDFMLSRSKVKEFHPLLSGGQNCIVSDIFTLQTVVGESQKTDPFCRLHLSDHSFLATSACLGFRRGLPDRITTALQIGVRRMTEADLLQRFVKYRVCKKNPQTRFNPVTLSTAIGPFTVLSGGLVISSLVLFFESYYASPVYKQRGPGADLDQRGPSGRLM